MVLDDLKTLLAQPTAPFKEQHVKKALAGWLDDAGVPFFEDPIGNFVLGVDSSRAYQAALQKKSREPLRIFIAHMDHPGFHGSRWNEGKLAIQWHGGSPTADLPGTKVWLADESGYVGEGTLKSPQLLKSGRALDKAEVILADPALSRIPAKKLWGSVGFRAPVWLEGETVYTKAADDLAGVFSVLSVAREVYAGKTKGKGNFIGLLTRAEEVGFIGTIGHLNWAKIRPKERDVIVVSLEASRTLPGAEIGKGPVVRLGDRATPFDPDGTQVLTQLAKKLLKEKFQRRLMDGGTCEATAAIAFGLPAVGMSLPLGNYHNQNFEGGPDSRAAGGSAPEFVNLNDIRGMLALCRGLLTPGLEWRSPWKSTRARFDQSLKSFKKHL